MHYPVALEGALKLKEISYIHAEGYPTAEMKHGPIALVDEFTPCVFVRPRGLAARENALESRGSPGPPRAHHRRGHPRRLGARSRRSLFLPIPDAPEIVQPLLAVVPLQLLAYHVALQLGKDIDKPRNLAKSVTVE